MLKCLPARAILLNTMGRLSLYYMILIIIILYLAQYMEGTDGHKMVSYDAQDLVIIHTTVKEFCSVCHTHMDAHVLQDFKELTVIKV